MANVASVSLVGERALRARINAIRDLPKTIANDPRVAETIVERTKDRFRTKKGPDGKRWKALSKEFVFRRVNDNVSDILRDTGTLEDSIGLTGRRGFATGLGFRIGITDPQEVAAGALHQGGGVSPLTGGIVPARPFLGISKQDLTIIERLLKRIVKEKVG